MFSQLMTLAATHNDTVSGFIKPVLLPFALSRIFILVLASALEWLLITGRAYRYAYIDDLPLATLSATFDANWYASIAAGGYATSPDFLQQQNYTFLPLYPLLMRFLGDLSGLGRVEGGYNLVGVVLSHVFFLISLVLFYQLTIELWKDEGVAIRSVWLICALPWSYIFSMAYTEALFLSLSLGVLLIAYRARKRPSSGVALSAGLLAALALLTRHQGIMDSTISGMVAGSCS